MLEESEALSVSPTSTKNSRALRALSTNQPIERILTNTSNTTPAKMATAEETVALLGSMHATITHIELSCEKKAAKKRPSVTETSFNSVEVEFPPGPMGLELEPVIISSERQIGCRVKDFYFGVDHTGIDWETLTSAVKIGDVISHVQKCNVQSAKFADILNQLRDLKDATRVVTFKNISASCKGDKIVAPTSTMTFRSSYLVTVFLVRE